MEPVTVEQSAPPATVFQEKVGTSGIVGGEGDLIDKHKLMSTKTLDFWSVFHFVTSPFQNHDSIQIESFHFLFQKQFIN